MTRSKQQLRLAAAQQAEAERQAAAFTEADKALTEALIEAEDLTNEATATAANIIVKAQQEALRTILPTGKRPLNKMLSKLDVNHLRQIAEVAQRQIDLKTREREKQHSDLLAINKINKLVADLLSKGYQPRQIDKQLHLPVGYSDTFVVNR